MTDRKEKILHSALELFANVGYNATATIKIAQHAGVSEGLIFRHFGNKKGLLDALMQEADRRVKELITPILSEKNPSEVIRKTIELPFGIENSEHDFWRLQFKLKWEKEYNSLDKMEPLRNKLEWAFRQLNATSPTEEAQLLSYMIDAISTEILRQGLDQAIQLKGFLLAKYMN